MASHDHERPEDPLQARADALTAKLDAAAGLPGDITLAHLRALRREIAANSEALQTVLKHVARQGERLDDMSARMEKNFQAIKIDIAHLELKDISRHGELLAVLRKLEHIDEDA